MKQFLEFPTRIHNAIIILSFLAGHKGRYAASLSLISKYLGLSYNYLEQVMPPLKRAGIIKAYRGSAGGYRLAKPVAAISILDVIVALDGDFQIAACVGGACKIEKKCPSKKIHQKIQNELRKSLNGITIADV
jgi:Rrf2 family protein